MHNCLQTSITEWAMNTCRLNHHRIIKNIQNMSLSMSFDELPSANEKSLAKNSVFQGFVELLPT